MGGVVRATNGGLSFLRRKLPDRTARQQITKDMPRERSATPLKLWLLVR